MSSSAASPSPLSSSSPCAAQLYNIPVQEASCAMPYGGNHTDIMSACCGSTSVVSYYNNCGLFCLAEDQTVHQLTNCLFDHGASYSDVFCRGKVTAEAHGQATVAASASAHVVGAAASATTTSSSQSSSSAEATAAGTRYEPRLSKLGLAFGVLLLAPAWLI